MRTCLVNTYFPPWRGGAETYVLNLARNLVEKGHSVEAVCASHTGRPSLEIAPGITVRRLKPLGLLYGVPILPALAFHLLRVRADIIHVNFPNPYNALISGIIAKLRGIPAALTWHNDLPPVTPAASVLVRLHDRLLTPLYCSLYSIILSTSSEYAASSPVLRRCRGRVRTIPNGVDCRRFRPELDGEAVRARYGLHGVKVVLFVSALTKWHRYKGLPVLLQAIQLSKSRMPDVRLLVVGDGDQRPSYEAMARSSGIGDRVIFAGDVPEEDLPYHYAASDVLVLPSLDRSEGFGVVLLEANACGKAVLASRVGGIPSYVKDGCNGVLVEPRDPAMLARKLIALLNEKSVDAVSCREAAEAYDWRKVVDQMLLIYKSLLT